MSESKHPPDVAEEALHALRNTQPVPDPGRMELERQAFLAQARRLRQAGPVSSRQVVRHRKWMMQPLRKGWASMSGLVRALLVLALLSGSAAGTAAAADASLPGQPLYGVDALMERTRLQLASTPEQQAQIALQLAEERANELNQLADNGSPLVAAETIRLQTQTQEALRLAAQLDDPQMLQLLTRLQQMTQTQEQLMAQRSLLDGAAVMAQVRTEAQVGLTDPGAFRAMVQARNMIQAGQDDPAEDEPVDEGDETTLPDDETTDEVTDLPGQNGNNTDPGDPEPGNDTPGIGQQGNSSHGGNEAAGTPGPHGNNVDPGDPAPGNDDAGNGQQGGDGNNGGEQGGGNK